MKISIKTLKGEQFQVDAELTDTIMAVKEKVGAERSDMPANRLKLIHTGKVLKDDSTVEENGIKEGEFLVCMVTKDAPAPRPATAAAAAPAPAPTPTHVSAPAPVQSTPPSTGAAPSAQPAVEISPETVAMLTMMGFPEAEARYALTVARGNGDLAVEFLTNGIPEQLRQPRSGPGAHAAPVPVAGGGPLAQLRSHPQFAQLQALVQANPAAIDQVLEAIGQQDPNLLATIHANHDEFVAMMNEPIGQAPPQVAPQAHGHPGGVPGGPPNMLQVIQMLQMMPPQARAQALQGMGLGPQQQQHFNQLLALPPDQLQMALGAMGAMGGQMGGPMGGPQQGVIHLSAEELASVRRLQELGFSEQEAAQAFLACDKNEGLAANFLLEGGFGDDDDGGFGDDGGDGGDGDDMYN